MYTLTHQLMVVYFCHHLSDIYVDLSDLYVDLSHIHVLENKCHTHKTKLSDKST